MDESQDSGGSGNFLSPGVGQGLASPNRSAPPAASARASRGRRAPYKGGRALGPHALRAPGSGPRLPAPQAPAARAPAPGREEGTDAARRGLPAGPASPARNEWGHATPLPPLPLAFQSGGQDEDRCGRRWLLGPPRGEPPPAFPSHPTPPGVPPDRGRPGCPTVARSPQLLAVRPRNSPVVRL